jgi:hypothetical protein
VENDRKSSNLKGVELPEYENSLFFVLFSIPKNLASESGIKKLEKRLMLSISLDLAYYLH